MKLNKKLEIGLNVVAFLKDKETPVKAADIAIGVGTTVSFLEQVIRELRSNDLVKSKHGHFGGYVLNKDKEISAFLVATAVGRTFGAKNTSDSASDRLQRSIVEAFKTTIL